MEEPAAGTEIEMGDIVCCYTGFADKLLELGAAVLVSDNRAVEFEHAGRPAGVDRGPGLPIHELCLFKLGIHLGEMWNFTEIAEWLEANDRTRFFLTAPPLFLPGALGSPANPIGTV